ncbi:D-mannonate oxidoreductase [Rhodovulum sp. P5]|uniref:mannitol dehydrogenase family protein n=1 Tax=Rhodovulum sp. P5 TaxID=1564506 RepID=UPI0009C29946|nr:mannitol dehydrogenase family protein [Rhodovulum sp. P5]ARE42108.1 D-mannonate oxidoreductase [Rhodovulum sp. P5]
MRRLDDLRGLPDTVLRPAYDPWAHGAGIVHIGLGAFHKAHQAAYTDAALAARGGDWRIIGVSLRSADASEALEPQNGLYTLIARDAEGQEARVIGAIARALALPRHRAEVLQALCDPATRIVSLTVTEKGYGIDRATGGIDRTHPAIAADLADPDTPTGVAGLLVWALGQRLAARMPPFAVLCCDNLPDNGSMLRRLLADFAREAAPALVSHIETEVAFPATMVDRITPAGTDATRSLAADLTGRQDMAAVETERFTQWVIEDHFPSGRPAWDAAGALFVGDVAPYEKMKLRMLNGAHSMLAYAGFLAGHAHVRDVMADAALVGLIRRHMGAAAATLPPLPGIDPAAYAEALLTRFANPHLAHQTYQIAMDGTEKMPQRIFSPAGDAHAAGPDLAPFAFATAAWMRYVLGYCDSGQAYALRDPREALLRDTVAGCETAAEIVTALQALPGLVPPALAADGTWSAAVAHRLSVMMEHGMRAAIDRECAA